MQYYLEQGTGRKFRSLKEVERYLTGVEYTPSRKALKLSNHIGVSSRVAYFPADDLSECVSYLGLDVSVFLNLFTESWLSENDYFRWNGKVQRLIFPKD